MVAGASSSSSYGPVTAGTGECFSTRPVPLEQDTMAAASTVPEVPLPDPVGMKSRPYDLTRGRPYPHLEEHRVVYRSEKGNGTYPLWSVPRFSDVIDDDMISQVGRSTWLRTREIRRAEERKALFEETPFLSPDAYEWKGKGEMLPYQHGINVTVTACSVSQWVVHCYSEMQKVCYPGQVSPNLRNWCYVCHNGPAQRVQLVRCLLCDNVFMCKKHRIFPDLIHSGNAIANSYLLSPGARDS
eukprot:1542051-Amphidinium_carterae.3